MTLSDYNEMLKSQGHSCALCHRHEDEFKMNLSVDHDHKTLEVRGLLCTYCNRRLVGRHRDGDLLRRIADYVEQGRGFFAPKKRPKRRRKKTR